MVDTGLTPRGRIRAAVAALIALCTLLQVAGLAPLMRYDRGAIAAGELWRLVTGHLVHLGPMHLALNAAGLVLVAALVGNRLGVGAWGVVFLTTALTISGGLWLAAPRLTWYVGLSGVLHGLLVAGAVRAAQDVRERWFALAVLLVVALKLAWEQAVGSMPATAALAGGRVVVDAHLYGALGGLAAMGLLAAAAAIRPGRR